MTHGGRAGGIALSVCLLCLCGCAGTGAGQETAESPVEAGVSVHTLRASLERVAELEEEFFSRYRRHAVSLLELGYEPPSGVDIRLSLDFGPDGYAAVATGGGAECAVFRSPARPPRYYLTRSGAVACSP